MKDSQENKILKSDKKSRNPEAPPKTSSTESLQSFDKLVQVNKSKFEGGASPLKMMTNQEMNQMADKITFEILASTVAKEIALVLKTK